MPNLAWTYTTLLAALQAWPRNVAAAYVAQLPSIIGLGERRLWRELNLEEYDKVDISISTALGNRLVAKPTDVIQLRTVAYGPTFVFLEKRTYDFCFLFSPTDTGEPKYYAELNSSQILVAPTPNAVTQMHYRYIGLVSESLSAALPELVTWLSRAAPDALFSACLMEAEQYLKADDRYGDFRDKYYNELLPVARLELRNSQRNGDGGPMRAADAVE